jgi:hypothetical protein
MVNGVSDTIPDADFRVGCIGGWIIEMLGWLLTKEWKITRCQETRIKSGEGVISAFFQSAETTTTTTNTTEMHL